MVDTLYKIMDVFVAVIKLDIKLFISELDKPKYVIMTNVTPSVWWS